MAAELNKSATPPVAAAAAVPYLSVRTTAADWMSSWVGFTSALCLSHPFSTMAVRWQTLNKRPLETIRVDGVRSLYRGIIPPMIFAGPFVASTFATNEFFRRYFRAAPESPSAPPPPLTTIDLLRSGFMSGITMSIVACPMAFVRVQQQNSGINGNPSTTFVKTVQTTYARHGVVGFYKAWHVDIVASSTAWMVYFTAYDVAKVEVARALGKPAPVPGEKAPVFDSILAGLATSVATWTLCMPTDLMRNRMQADAARDPAHRLYQGAVDCVVKTYRADGIRGFWRGLSLTIARSAASSCVSLPVYDRLKPRFRRWLGVEAA